MPVVAVLVTASSPREARRLSDALLKERLVACVNVLPGVVSRYWWKGKIASGREVLLVAKTVASKLPAVVRRVKALHSYEVPEVLALPAAGGNPAYLKWVRDETGERP
jgi:periplasmic divalent cation tolerance protein